MTSEVVLTKRFNFCSYILGILQIQKKPYICLYFHKNEGKIALNLSKLSNSVVLNLIEVCWRIGSWLIRFLIEGYNTTSFYIFHCNLIMQSQKCVGHEQRSARRNEETTDFLNQMILKFLDSSWNRTKDTSCKQQTWAWLK